MNCINQTNLKHDKNKSTEKRLTQRGVYLSNQKIVCRRIYCIIDKLENILTTDNPLSNWGAKAMTVGFSFSAVHVPVKLGL